MYKKCLLCQKEYSTSRTKQKYCSNECQWTAKKEVPPVRICVAPDCGNSFAVDRKSNKKKYCSSSCSARTSNKKHPRRKPEGECLFCLAPISSKRRHCDECLSKSKPNISTERICHAPKCEIKYSVPANSIKIFCSKECRNIAFKAGSYGNRKRICECGNVKSPNSYFCRLCNSLNKTKGKINAWLLGEWDGAVTNGLSRVIRKYLIAEANNACSECGFNTVHPDDGASILEVDHVDGDGTNHSPDNLRVLCPNCHALTSSYRGRNLGNGKRTKYYIRIG